MTQLFLLNCREVTVEDVSKKYSLDLRLLFGVAYGEPWFARWGYGFRLGSFGLDELTYTNALDHLSFLSLDSLLVESNANPSTGTGELHRIITSYLYLHPFGTVRDLLRHLIDLIKHQTALAAVSPPDPPLKVPPLEPKAKKARTERKKPGSCRDFTSIAAHLASRWPVRRLVAVAQVVVDALVEHGRMMTRQEVRDAARMTIGDTGLIDFVLKSLGNTVINHYIVRRKSNPFNRVLEFSVDKLPSSAGSAGAKATTEADTADAINAGEVTAAAGTSYLQNLQTVCKCLMAMRPREAQLVLNAKHWAKTFDLRDEADDLLRFYIQWMPSVKQIAGLTRPLPPPEIIALDMHASIGDLKTEAEYAMRDTACLMEQFRVTGVEGVDGDCWEAVMFAGVQSGATIWVTGEGVDMECKLKYEGGADTWAVGCVCGARDDDGERMVACDACDVWHHTRCSGVEDGEPVPQLFLCLRCGSSILAAAAAEEEGMGFGMGIEV